MMKIKETLNKLKDIVLQTLFQQVSGGIKAVCHPGV